MSSVSTPAHPAGSEARVVARKLRDLVAFCAILCRAVSVILMTSVRTMIGNILAGTASDAGDHRSSWR